MYAAKEHCSKSIIIIYVKITATGENIEHRTMNYNFQKKMIVKSDHGDDLLGDIVDIISAGNCMDATIICGNGRLKQNSFLLSVLFPMFRKVVKNHYSPDLVISMPDMDVQELRTFFQHFVSKSFIDIDIGDHIFELLDLHKNVNIESIQPKKEQSPFSRTLNINELLPPVKIRISNMKEASNYFNDDEVENDAENQEQEDMEDSLPDMSDDEKDEDHEKGDAKVEEDSSE